ncbi:MAG: hypothetical protein JEZ14_07710 [Marinilabiliaceae bacterium]|nr:hypothetical protein [Marinilabiliaceae bacterium]
MSTAESYKSTAQRDKSATMAGKGTAQRGKSTAERYRGTSEPHKSDTKSGKSALWLNMECGTKSSSLTEAITHYISYRANKDVCLGIICVNFKNIINAFTLINPPLCIAF